MMFWWSDINSGGLGPPDHCQCRTLLAPEGFTIRPVVTLMSHHVNLQLTVCPGVIITEVTLVWSDICEQTINQ